MYSQGCDIVLLGVCLTKAEDSGTSIFDFPDFLTALALLALAFNASDQSYRFKIEIAPIPLRRIAFLASILVGLATLLTDLWFAQGWYSLPWGWSKAAIQAALGGIFLAVILLWLWYAFLARTNFTRWNYKRFHNAIYWRLVRGSDAELATIAEHIPQAAEALIRRTAPTFEGNRRAEGPPPRPGIAEYAHDTLWLLGARKFCRVVMATAPHSAIALMHEASRQRKYHVPLGMFAQNITVEAILNPDSQIYHEDSNSLTSVFSQLQPFSRTIYGDYSLVEGTGEFESAFDVDWQAFQQFTAAQWEAYCSLVLITTNAFVASKPLHTASRLLARAMSHIESASRDIYQVDSVESSTYRSEPLAKLSASVDFAREAMTAFDKANDFSGIRRRVSRSAPYGQLSVLDRLTDLLYRIILDASAVRGPPDLVWVIYYNSIWSTIFTHEPGGDASRRVLFKLRRRLFDEIKQMEEIPNFEGARILGFCLNIVAFDYNYDTRMDRSWIALGKAVTAWTRRNYLRLRAENLRVAEACMIGRVTFDAESNRIVKTYAQGLRAEVPSVSLSLDLPRRSPRTRPHNGTRRRAANRAPKRK